MFGLGPWELVILGIILLLLFGSKKIPEIGKGLGATFREVKNIKKDLSSSDASAPESEESEKKEPGLLKESFTGKMMDQVPGVKKAREINDKINKVKSVI